jgi:hypothetical protein
MGGTLRCVTRYVLHLLMSRWTSLPFLDVRCIIIYKYKVFSKYIRKFLGEFLFIFIYFWRIIVLLCFMKINLCFSISCSIVFVLLNGHCVINRWCSHMLLSSISFKLIWFHKFFFMRLWQKLWQKLWLNQMMVFIVIGFQ